MIAAKRGTIYATFIIEIIMIVEDFFSPLFLFMWSFWIAKERPNYMLSKKILVRIAEVLYYDKVGTSKSKVEKILNTAYDKSTSLSSRNFLAAKDITLQQKQAIEKN